MNESGWLAGLQVATGVVSLAGGLIGLVQFFVDPKDRIERYVKSDPEYRENLARQLERIGWASAYRDRFQASLCWLDRFFGPPLSSSALGVCIVAALVYAWIAFFVGYGLSNSGSVGDFPILKRSDAISYRVTIVILVCSMPIISFLLGIRIGRFERHCKIRARRRLNFGRKRNFEIIYRFILSATIVFPILILMSQRPALGQPSWAMGSMATLALGPAIGVMTTRYVHGGNLRGQLASVLAAVLVTILAWSLALISAGVIHTVTTGELVKMGTTAVGAETVALAWAGVIAAIAAVAGAAPLIGAAVGTLLLALGLEITDVGLQIGGGFAITVAAVAGALGATIAAERRHVGAVAGAICAVATFGAIVLMLAPKGGDNKVVAITLVIFFLVLPMANGIWDWLSWWVTRWLGAHLLNELQADRKMRSLTLLLHALADLLLAIILLLSMAFTIAFGFELFNQLFFARAGEIGFDLQSFLENASSDPFGVGFWLTAMLLSTLLPTLLHLLLLVISPIAFRMLPSSERLTLARELRSFNALKSKQVSIERRAANYLAKERHLDLIPAAMLSATIAITSLFLINSAIKESSAGHTNIAVAVLNFAKAGISTAKSIGVGSTQP